MFVRRFFSSCYVFLLTLSLGACGYAVDSSNQDITFLTPGAQNAKCYVYVNKLKYQVLPPQTVNIKQMTQDMKIDCRAPGNRQIEMVIPSKFTSRSLWGGPAGMAWDYASQSMFHYPSVIAIDFSQQDIKPNPLPQYNNSDVRQPETYDLEEFSPSTPQLNSDKNKVLVPLTRHGDDSTEYYDMEEGTSASSQHSDKGSLQSVIDNLSVSTPPTGASESDAAPDSNVLPPSGGGDDAPVSLYPGQ